MEKITINSNCKSGWRNGDPTIKANERQRTRMVKLVNTKRDEGYTIPELSDIFGVSMIVTEKILKNKYPISLPMYKGMMLSYKNFVKAKIQTIPIPVQNTVIEVTGIHALIAETKLKLLFRWKRYQSLNNYLMR